MELLNLIHLLTSDTMSLDYQLGYAPRLLFFMFLQEISQKIVKPAKHEQMGSVSLKEPFLFQGFKQEYIEAKQHFSSNSTTYHPMP